MSIRHAILGFLSWKAFTGYELKKLFADSLSFHWTGNNNQIYGSLIDLHRDGRVTQEVLPQEKLPARKVYAITQAGREELRAWLLGEPELPQVRDSFHMQLAWAEALTEEELGRLLDDYARILEAQVLMCRERVRRGQVSPGRSPREILVWTWIERKRVEDYERELDWLSSLRAELAALAPGWLAALSPKPASAQSGSRPGSRDASPDAGECV